MQEHRREGVHPSFREPWTPSTPYEVPLRQLRISEEGGGLHKPPARSCSRSYAGTARSWPAPSPVGPSEDRCPRAPHEARSLHRIVVSHVVEVVKRKRVGRNEVVVMTA